MVGALRTCCTRLNLLLAAAQIGPEGVRTALRAGLFRGQAFRANLWLRPWGGTKAGTGFVTAFGHSANKRSGECIGDVLGLEMEFEYRHIPMTVDQGDVFDLPILEPLTHCGFICCFAWDQNHKGVINQTRLLSITK